MSSPINEKLRQKRGNTRKLDAVAENGFFGVRERETSLLNLGQFDHRKSSEQEGRLYYAARATRGYRI